MKAGVAAALFATIAVADAGTPLRGDIALLTTVAEETGGAGAISWSLGAERVDAVIVTEPTQCQIAPVHTGSLFFRLSLTGRAAHACVRETGVSAIEKFIDLHEELRAYERARNAGFRHPLYESRTTMPIPTNVGVVRGGEWLIMVPESLTIEGRIGMAPGEDVDEVRKDFEDRISAWARRDDWLAAHPPLIEWLGNFPASETSRDEEIVHTLGNAYERMMGERPVVAGVTYGTDMAHFIRLAGLPTIIFGPGNIEQAHSTDEFVDLDDLLTATKVLAAAIEDWCA